MDHLPTKERVLPGNPLFTQVGVDYIGPLMSAKVVQTRSAMDACLHVSDESSLH